MSRPDRRAEIGGGTREAVEEDQQAGHRERLTPVQAVANEAAERGGRELRGVAGRVDQAFGGDLARTVGLIPEDVESRRDRHDPQAPALGAPAGQLDGDAGHDRDAEARAARGHQQAEHRGEVVEAPSPALEQRPRRKAARHRQQVADLKGPQQVFPGGAQEQDQRRRKQGRDAGDAPRRQDVDERSADQVQDGDVEAKDRVVVEPDQVKEQPVERGGEDRDVADVSDEQPVRAAVVVVDHPFPLVVVERQPAPHVHEQSAGERQQRGQRPDGVAFDGGDGALQPEILHRPYSAPARADSCSAIQAWMSERISTGPRRARQPVSACRRVQSEM